MLEMNAWDPQKENFANLEPSQLERYRDVDGMFTFRMMWSDPSDVRAPGLPADGERRSPTRSLALSEESEAQVVEGAECLAATL